MATNVVDSDHETKIFQNDLTKPSDNSDHETDSIQNLVEPDDTFVNTPTITDSADSITPTSNSNSNFIQVLTDYDKM